MTLGVHNANSISSCTYGRMCVSEMKQLENVKNVVGKELPLLMTFATYILCFELWGKKNEEFSWLFLCAIKLQKIELVCLHFLSLSPLQMNAFALVTSFSAANGNVDFYIKYNWLMNKTCIRQHKYKYFTRTSRSKCFLTFSPNQTSNLMTFFLAASIFFVSRVRSKQKANIWTRSEELKKQTNFSF